MVDMEDSPASDDHNVRRGTPFDVESLWRACDQLPYPDDADPLIGRSFDGVTLVRMVAEGGMGRVYEGLQENPRRTVAVKVIRPGLLSRELVTRFIREAAVLASLQHPYISQIHSAGTFPLDGVVLPYFVMEFISDSRSITSFAKEKNLNFRKLLTLFRSVCDAVAYGHERGIVHRDLKPSNILVDGYGHPKIIDFGIAWNSTGGEQLTTITAPGDLLGTLQYMSPEQLPISSAPVDARTDVYSLGVIFYELLTGSLPYVLDSASILEGMAIVQTQKPTSLRIRLPSLPRPIGLLVEKCLAKDRAMRFANARELTGALDDALAKTTTDRQRPGSRIPSAERLRVISGISAVFTTLILTTVYLKSPYGWLGYRQPPGTSQPRPWPITTAASSPRAQGESNREQIAELSLMAQPAETKTSASEFCFAIRDINQPGSDTYLVSSKGMRKWSDRFMFPLVSYWAPESNGSEGELVYRFEFGRKSRDIHFTARSDCWDFSKEPGGVGRGASAIQVSRDGKQWISVADNIEPRRWGQVIHVKSYLPPEVLGGHDLWVRVRCLTEGAPVADGYSVAQFARTRPGEKRPVFEVRAQLSPD